MFDSPEQANLKGAVAARYIREHYNTEIVGEHIAGLLNNILVAQGYDPLTLETEASE